MCVVFVVPLFRFSVLPNPAYSPSLSHCPALPFSLSLSLSRDYVYTYATRLMTNNTPICSPAASFATQKQHFNHRTKRSQRSLDKRYISKKLSPQCKSQITKKK